MTTLSIATRSPGRHFLRITAAIACLLMPRAAFTQESDSVQSSVATKPGLKPGYVYYVRGDSILTELRDTPVEPRGSVGAGDVVAMLAWGGGGKTWMTVPLETSGITIAEPRPTFRIAIDRVTALSIRLGAFEVKKGKRWAQTNEGRPAEFFRKGIPLDVKEESRDVWLLSPKTDLKPGEYALAVNTSGPVSDFTVAGLSKPAKKRQ